MRRPRDGGDHLHLVSHSPEFIDHLIPGGLRYHQRLVSLDVEPRSRSSLVGCSSVLHYALPHLRTDAHQTPPAGKTYPDVSIRESDHHRCRVVEGTLAGCHRVPPARTRVQSTHPVPQYDSRTSSREARAEGASLGDRDRGDVPLHICRPDVERAIAPPSGLQRYHPVDVARKLPYGLNSPCGIFLAQKQLDGHVHKIRIPQIQESVSPHPLQHFRPAVPEDGRVLGHGVQTIHHMQSLETGNASVGKNRRKNLRIPVGDPIRLRYPRPKGCHVLPRQNTSPLAHAVRNLVTDLPLVEIAPSRCGNPLERLLHVRSVPGILRSRQPALGHEVAHRCLASANRRLVPAHGVGDRAEWEAVRQQFERRGDNIGPLQRPPTLP